MSSAKLPERRAREIDQGGFSTRGKSLGEIHGKAAADALTPDNQIAELYDPAVFNMH